MGIEIAPLLVHVLALAGVGGIWFWAFVGQLSKRPLLALNDPGLYEAVGKGHHGEEAASHG